MKIRLDYVTNSSSVSFIISMDPDMAEFFKKKNKDFSDNPIKRRVYQLLHDDMESAGAKTMVCGEEVLATTRRFEKKSDCLYDRDLDVKDGAPDISGLSDDELWRYICGEYLVNGRLASELKGFGAVQVPRDRRRIREKFCQHADCETCEKRDTPRCHSLGA